MSTTARQLLQRAAIALGLLVAGAAGAADIEGTLTLRWGDPLNGAAGGEKLQAEIAGKRGYTYAIDAAQALADGLPLFDMNGDEVVASVDASRKTGAGFRLTRLESTGLKSAGGIVDARPWINLLCKFADNPAEPTTIAHVDAAFGAEGELTRFWRDASQGAVDVSRTRSLGWFVLPNPTAAYFDANGNPNLTKILNECGAAAGEALATALQGEDHAGVNLLVNGSLGCCAWGGNTRIALGGITKTWRVTWMPPAGYLNLSLFGHELGHTFGMAHSNNSDGDGNTYDNPWDLLSDADGHAVAHAQFGRLPKTPSAYHLDRAGWLLDDEKVQAAADGSTQVSLQRVDRAAPGAVRLLRIDVPGATGGRYWTVEARIRNGSNDGALPDSGVVLYEVDPRRAQPAWLVDASNPVANYSNTRSTVFKPGDRFVAPDLSFELKVLAAGTNGFDVEVTMPGPGFGSGFE
jgi:hypothetical protein